MPEKQDQKPNAQIDSGGHARSRQRLAPVVDAQVHVWAESTPERPWPAPQYPVQRVPPVSVEELLGQMSAAGVDRAILVPPMWEGPRNDLALAAARECPHTFAVMGRLDPADPKDIARLAEWRNKPGMLGVRLAFNRGAQLENLQHAVETGFFAEAERCGVPLMIYPPGICEAVGEIALRFPALRLILDHVALRTELKLGPGAPEIDPVIALARIPNVAVKASALPAYVTETFPFPSLREVVRRLIAAFGPERVFWGSDYSRLPCGYGEWLEAFAGYLDDLTEIERASVLGGGLLRWLNWR